MRGAGTRLQVLAMAVLGLAVALVRPDSTLGWLTLLLGGLTGLKLWEARTLGERRVACLLQLLCAGMVAAQRPELGPSLLLGLVVLLALAGLLGLEAGEEVRLRPLLVRSLRLLLAGLPLALALFLLVPRLEPLFALPQGMGRGAVTGLDPTLEPGAIATLVGSDAPAARVAFPAGGLPPPAARYWRVLVHERFDGRRWSVGDAPDAMPAGVESGRIAQLWLEEPSGLEAVPWSGAGRPLGPDLRLTATGELRHRGPSDHRRVYALAAGEASGWRDRPPTGRALELPAGANPRLEALAAEWARLGAPALRLAAAERWFRRQPFRYTLLPGTLPPQAPLDAFLFERRAGFCEHYASAFTALMRAAGVPARVVSGYLGGTWVEPLGGGGYLDLRRRDAHAWSEVWLAGRGWVRVDPTGWIARAGPATESRPSARATARGSEAGPLTWIVRQWWGLDLAWTRWWLGFDRQAQANLLRRLLGDAQGAVGVLLLAVMAATLAGAVALPRWLGERTGGSDPLRRELERWLGIWARLGFVPRSGETLSRFGQRLERRWPERAGAVAAFVSLHERLRHGSSPEPEGLAELRRLRRSLRRQGPARSH